MDLFTTTTIPEKDVDMRAGENDEQLEPSRSHSILQQTICKYFEYEEKCKDELQEARKTLDKSKIYCAGEFDNYMCWPHAEAGRMAHAHCPDFYADLDGFSVGYRYCQDNGSWYQQLHEDGYFVAWHHTDECTLFDEAENTTAIPRQDNESEAVFYKNIKIMYTIGYGVSLVCLVAALFFFAFSRRLRCTRNYIHVNLMTSFVLHHVVILVKDDVIRSYYTLDDLPDDHDPMFLRRYCDGSHIINIRCRIVMALMHYAVTAKYFWLLVEGIYLQMIILEPTSEEKYLKCFMIFGWGTPWIFVSIWIVLRVHFENAGCWDIDYANAMWTLRAPIMASIVINFFLFINIIRLIASKLRASSVERTDVEVRLAKVTLTLIPLLGIPYIIFLIMTPEIVGMNSTAMKVKLTVELFFGSIQGALVAILYCFLHNEVQKEVKRAWNARRCKSRLAEEEQHTMELI